MQVPFMHAVLLLLTLSLAFVLEATLSRSGSWCWPLSFPLAYPFFVPIRQRAGSFYGEDDGSLYSTLQHFERIHVACISTYVRTCTRTYHQALVAANPGDESALKKLLDSLQEDFVLFTKPGEASGGAPVFLAL